MPRQVQQRSIAFDMVLDFMRVGTAFSISDMRSVFGHFVDFLARNLPEGNTVQTSLGAFYLSIRRSYSADDSLDGSASLGHRISMENMTLRVRPDKDILDHLTAAAKVELVTVPSPARLTVLSVENIEKPDTLTEGSGGDVLRLSGNLLNFRKEDREIGVFFIGRTRERRPASYRKSSTSRSPT